MSRSKLLHDLQQLDAQRDAAVARLRQVVAELRGDGVVGARRDAVAVAETRLGEVEARLRRVEAERSDLKARIAGDEERLYAGRVTHPKEIEGLRRGIAGGKSRLGEADDQALELLVARDEAREALDAARLALAEGEREDAERQAELGRERLRLARAVKALEPRLVASRERLARADLALYDKLRGDRKIAGRAVAAVEGSACGACGMQLTRQHVIDAGAQEGLARCPGCGRILHA